MKLRVSLTDKGDDIGGTVQYEGNYADAKEALLTTLEAIAKSFGMTTKDLIIDIYRMDIK